MSSLSRFHIIKLAILANLVNCGGCDKDNSYKGTPTLTVEVLSKSTREKDLILKLNLYKDCGVKEYWIVNPDNKDITIYEFEEQKIKQFTTYRYNEIAESYIYDGLKVDVKKIFKE